MYKVKSIEVDGFWGERQASSSFREDVNIIIGKNGTGKTTFMNIMHAVLSVDIDGLCDNFFKKVSITISDGSRTKKITALRISDETNPFPLVEYKISNRKFLIPLIGGEEGRNFSPNLRRRASEDAQEVKTELSELVALASLSVYRLGGDVDPESRERVQRRHLSPVEQRLASLTHRLTQYQLELSTEARKISTDLQRDVLTSLLYSKSDADARGYPTDFDVDAERQKLTAAYNQLGVAGSEITRKIQFHVAAISEASAQLQEFTRTKEMPVSGIKFGALDAFARTSTVVELSLNAEKKINAIFEQINQFISILKQFVPDKSFVFEAGELVVSSNKPISLGKLSSGEKQLLILFIEALLQRRRPYIFLADEPELSLHISWQRSIISAIRSINPAAQIIVATHSPEIAGKYRSSILDMEDIRRV
ncbi:MAG: ATP-binding protein [Proteobacteria bacterium]|nr:MAG: ATP-binding protein [Pseudomonadota bacterium]